MRPVSSSSVTSVRGPRLRSSSTTPAIAAGLPPKKTLAAFRAGLRPVGFEIVGDTAGDEPRQVVHEAVDRMAADRAPQRLALAAQPHACRSTSAGPARWHAPPRERARWRDRRCRAGRFRSPCCSVRPAPALASSRLNSVARFAARPSRLPDLISASSTRRFTLERSRRRHRSSRLAVVAIGPALVDDGRDRPSPTPLMAPSP